MCEMATGAAGTTRGPCRRAQSVCLPLFPASLSCPRSATHSPPDVLSREIATPTRDARKSPRRVNCSAQLCQTQRSEDGAWIRGCPAPRRPAVRQQCGYLLLHTYRRTHHTCVQRGSLSLSRIGLGSRPARSTFGSSCILIDRLPFRNVSTSRPAQKFANKLW